ncbi:serine/threonine-protein kinase [Streptomyces sp. NPDC058008]|uniref:serine/threonine-protein kinase n=1 Tax=Streptomyces sp. NPDC058008 TaxID=3346303 RepID=UPI0036E464C1
MAGARVEPLGGGDPATLGRYRLIGRLASGGMGRIYLARDAAGQLAAVKTLLAEGVVGDDDRRRFAREVELAQRVDSAFTARVRDADPGAERPWMAIDYVAAPSLSELVRTAGVLSASAVQWVAAGTAEALVALHGVGIIHRDLKPRNILLPLPGPRVIDFGISHAHDLTRTTLTLGTIAFTSPEQARGEPSTEASDVYSLGATLFHLTLGRPPYRAGSDTLALLAQVQRGRLDLDGLPGELTALIRPCLEADPARRPTPAEMLARFRRSLAGLPQARGGRAWLPPDWTSLIGAYGHQGRELARDGTGPDGGTAVALPTGPARAHPQDHGRAEREQARRARDRLREAAEGNGRMRVRKQAARAGDAAVRAGQQASPASAAPPRPAPARPPAPPSARGFSGLSLLVVLAVVAMVLWMAGRPDGGTDSGSGAGADASASATTGSGTGPEPSGGTGASSPRPVPEPAPDEDDEAFGAVSSGDCLTASDDGYGDWSTDTPETVDCDAADAYLRVTSAGSGVSSSDCPSGSGASHWTHSGSKPEFGTTLCVQRQFRVGQCFPAKHRGDRMVDGRLLTVWGCGRGSVPEGYNAILEITGRWRAESAYPPGYCAESEDDREDYWRFEVDGDRTVLCVRWV